MGFSVGHKEKCPSYNLLLSLHYCRKSPRPGPAALPSIPEKDVADVTGEVISDEARSAGGAERSVKRYQPLENRDTVFQQRRFGNGSYTSPHVRKKQIAIPRASYR